MRESAAGVRCRACSSSSPATGRGDEVAALLAPHVAATRAEPGCTGFVANRSAEDGDRFVLYEQYADEAAFQAHRESRHFREYVLGGVVPLLAEREWERYSPVEPGA